MKRLVILVGETESGEFVDLVGGNKLHCVAKGNDIDKLIGRFREIRGGNGIVNVGKKEINLAEMCLAATHTAGGELKAPCKWHKKQ